MSSQVTRRTQSERTETAKARLRLAALELFALKGYDATQLADVSVRAGFSRGLAQYHYGDKTTLTLELLDARMRRDLHADLLICPPATAPDDAWARLMKHLDVSWEHYRQAHSTGRSNLAVRGAIQLQQAASMATDERMSERLNSLTAGLVSRIAHALALCREGGLLRADIDVQAVLYERLMPLSRVMNLAVGDTLLLDIKSDALVEMRCGDFLVTEGRMGRAGENVAVELARPVRRSRTTMAIFEAAEARKEGP